MNDLAPILIAVAMFASYWVGVLMGPYWWKRLGRAVGAEIERQRRVGG